MKSNLMLSIAKWPLTKKTRHYSTAGASQPSQPPKSLQTIGIVGAGQMGNGIALVAALEAKKDVIVVEKHLETIKKASSFIDGLLAKYVEKGRITSNQRLEARNRLVFQTDFSSLNQVDIVIEAIPECLQMKQMLLNQLAQSCASHAILASNTSSISITKLASSTPCSDRVIGMHFMNPVPVMKLVEIIPGLQTSQSTLDKTLILANEMGKMTAQSQDRPGFIANRLLMPYINEAILCLSENLATAEDIDKTMKLGTNMPMGPLALADFIGLDTCLAIMRVLYSEFSDSKYRPAPLLVRYVDAGWIGKKSGHGFYRYDQ